MAHFAAADRAASGPDADRRGSTQSASPGVGLSYEVRPPALAGGPTLRAVSPFHALGVETVKQGGGMSVEADSGRHAGVGCQRVWSESIATLRPLQAHEDQHNKAADNRNQIQQHKKAGLVLIVKAANLHRD